jgi:hypothetical protein
MRDEASIIGMQRQGIPLIARLVIDLARCASARCPR